VLKHVFLLTNRSDDWIGALKEQLKEDRWGEITTSRDVSLSEDGLAVNQSIDMTMANWVEMFPGNGICLYCFILSEYLLIPSTIPVVESHR